MSNSAETKRRSLFCCHYARLGDVAEAARCAGYPPETAAADGAVAAHFAAQYLNEQKIDAGVN